MTDLVALQSHIGQTLVRDDIVAPGTVRAALATFGRAGNPAIGDLLSPAWHMFHGGATDAPGDLGVDGLPRAYEVIPELPLPRRMFAGGRMRFHAPIRIGDAIRLESKLVSLDAKQGRTGALIFATVTNRISLADGTLATDEDYDIVAREAVPAGQANPIPPTESVPAEVDWQRTVPGRWSRPAVCPRPHGCCPASPGRGSPSIRACSGSGAAGCSPTASWRRSSQRTPPLPGPCSDPPTHRPTTTSVHVQQPWQSLPELNEPSRRHHCHARLAPLADHAGQGAVV